MPMKEWIQRLHPVQLYMVLALSTVYFAVQLFLSHVSHSMVLLVASYHMLCNIIALTGCLLAVKKSAIPQRSKGCQLKQDARSVSQQLTDEDFRGDASSEAAPPCDPSDGSNAAIAVVAPVASVAPATPPHEPEETALEIKDKAYVKARQARESTLKNTFGWARIDILTMLVVCILLASFCFSAIIEALQTLSHIHHQDAMHFPGEIAILGVLGLMLNAGCYLLIGGYTYHQGSFLYITSSGNVILDNVISGDGVRKGDRRLSGSRRHCSPSQLRRKTKRQSLRELLRDICSIVIVIVCSLIVAFTTEETAKFVDPALALLSCVILLILSFPYMKESGMILLQTIPDTIDIEIFKKTLLDGFKDIVSVHDLHIWQLSRNQYVSTVHIIFACPKVYLKIQNDVIEFFHEQGINQVTIQPEFELTDNGRTLGDGKQCCLIQCREIAQCASRQCCETVAHKEADKLEEVIGLPAVAAPPTGETIPLAIMPQAQSVEGEEVIEKCISASNASHLTAKDATETQTQLNPVCSKDAAPEAAVTQTEQEDCTGTTTVQLSPVKTESEQQHQQQAKCDSSKE